ncbi:uncharacterized protein ISCGN_004426 [Ixodes scapularis]
MGVHNTLQELIQAHLASQQERLALTPTGRTVLHNLHFPIPSSVRNTVRLPTAIRDHIQVAPIPKNMHPILHSGRRIARARALQHKYSSKADTRFTDAAMYSDQPAAAVSVIDHDLKTVVTASIRTINPVEAEETAIALAIASGKEYLNILSDSQTALRRFRAGRISPCALRILTDLKTPLPETTLIWTPGHESVDGNRQAHAVARACTHRVPQTEDHNTILKFIPVPNQYSEILIHQRGERFRYPPPHRSLTREEAAIWRQLQSHTYRHLALLHKFYPTMYPASCPHCSGYPSLYHVTWACQSHPSLPPISSPSPETWEAALLSSHPDDQRSLVERAKAAAASTGALD